MATAGEALPIMRGFGMQFSSDNDTAGRATTSRAKSLLLAACDAGIAVVILGLCTDPPIATSAPRIDTSIFAAAVAGPLFLARLGSYDIHRSRLSTARVVARLAAAAAAMAVVSSAVNIATHRSAQPFDSVLAALLVVMAWSLARLAAGIDFGSERLLVVGDDPEDMSAAVLRESRRGTNLLGSVGRWRVDGTRRLGAIAELPALIREHRVDRVIVASLGGASEPGLAESLRLVCDTGLAPDISLGPRPAACSFRSTRQQRGSAARPVAAASKRGIDIAGAATLVCILAPIMALIAIAILVTNGRPVLFRQERVGRCGKRFVMLKFRSMFNGAEAETLTRARNLVGYGHDFAKVAAALKPAGDPRTTRIGRLLRRTSLDELPQLFNILAGDMSLVGPRPLCTYEVATLNEWQNQRHDVRPGLTGLWQVLGRCETGWHSRLMLDYAYARSWTLRGDAAILMRTIPAVIAKRGAS